jgi:hypothetical protein
MRFGSWLGDEIRLIAGSYEIGFMAGTYDLGLTVRSLELDS